jgi:hypothetical protein
MQMSMEAAQCLNMMAQLNQTQIVSNAKQDT